jgi:hypothetical protein
MSSSRCHQLPRAVVPSPWPIWNRNAIQSCVAFQWSTGTMTSDATATASHGPPARSCRRTAGWMTMASVTAMG